MFVWRSTALEGKYVVAVYGHVDVSQKQSLSVFVTE